MYGGGTSPVALAHVGAAGHANDRRTGGRQMAPEIDDGESHARCSSIGPSALHPPTPSGDGTATAAGARSVARGPALLGSGRAGFFDVPRTVPTRGRDTATAATAAATPNSNARIGFRDWNTHSYSHTHARYSVGNLLILVDRHPAARDGPQCRTIRPGLEG